MAPIAGYFKGSGDKVMDSMKKTYGDTSKAKSVFYSLANKQNMKPSASGMARVHKVLAGKKGL